MARDRPCRSQSSCRLIITRKERRISPDESLELKVIRPEMLQDERHCLKSKHQGLTRGDTETLTRTTLHELVSPPAGSPVLLHPGVRTNRSHVQALVPVARVASTTTSSRLPTQAD